MELDHLISLIEDDYDNAELTVEILVKLSRKFSEVNVYTKLKAMVIVHRVMQAVPEKIKLAWSSAFNELSHELDEKVGQNFFDISSISEAANKVNNVGEMLSSYLARDYSEYVQHYLATVRKFLTVSTSNKKSSKVNESTTTSELAESWLKVATTAEEIQETCKKFDSALSNQIRDLVNADLHQAVKMLIKHFEVE